MPKRDKRRWKKPSLTVDAVVISGEDFIGIKRKNPPFKGSYALPGGFVDYGETLEKAVLRELEEETSIKGEIVALIGVFSEPERDPRGHTVSVAYLVKALNGALEAGDDADDARWLSCAEPGPLAFDHTLILCRALELKGRLKLGKGKKRQEMH